MVQLNNFTGFEPQDGSEASAINGTPTYPTTGVRTGGACLQCNATESFTLPWVAANVTDAGSGYVFGFAASVPSGDQAYITILDDAGGTILDLRWDTDGTVDLRNANGGILDTSAGTYDDGSFHFFEVYAELNSASGAWEWFIDGTSEGSGTGADLTDGNAFGSSSSGLDLFALSAGSTIKFDDVYILSGATAATDAYGDFAVRGYNNTAAGATDNGSTLATGTWANCAEVPFSITNEASYTANNANGSTDTDAGTNSGPNGDSGVSGTIKGAKWVINAYRTNGSQSNPYIIYGDTGGTTNAVDGTDITLGTSPGTFTFLSESTNVPSTSQYFTLGMGKGTGGRDIFTTDHMGMLGFVPQTSTPVNLDTLSYTHTLPAHTFAKTTAVSLDALSYTHTLPAHTFSKTTTVSLDALSYTETLPTHTFVKTTKFNANALAYTHTLPDQTFARTLKVNLDALSYTHTIPAATFAKTTPVTLDALSYTHTLPDITIAAQLVVDLDTLSYTHTLPTHTITKTTPVALDALSYTHTLNTITLGITHKFTADALSYTHTLPDLTITQGEVVTVDTITYTHTLPTHTFARTLKFNADALSYTHTLPDQTFVRTHKFNADALAYTHSLPDATFTRTVPVTLDALSYTHTLPDITINEGTVVSLDTLSYTHTLPDLTISTVVQVNLDALAYTETLNDIAVARTLKFNADALSYTHTLPTHLFGLRQTISLDALSYTETLPDIAIARTLKFNADANEYTHTLNSLAIFNWARHTPASDPWADQSAESDLWVVQGTDGTSWTEQ